MTSRQSQVSAKPSSRKSGRRRTQQIVRAANALQDEATLVDAAAQELEKAK